MQSGAEHPTKTTSRRHGGWQLLVFWDGGNETVDLRADAELVLGRAHDNDVCIPLESVSRRHAVLRGSDGMWSVEDLGSSNGTFVAGTRLQPGEPRAITTGMIVKLGDARFLLDGGGVSFAPPPGTMEPALDEAMEAVERLVDVVAGSMLSVLLLGETGVGKGKIATEIHQRSPRVRGPFVRLNCPAVPEALLESELFGHERGAFTGAVKAKVGLLETANGGTVFLDEVGEIPDSVQAKLLHVLEHNEVMRVGAVQPRTIDVRFVAATNQSLAASGRFRRDLYFRLAGVPIRIPPLRERRREIAAMVRLFTDEACRPSGHPAPEISAAALRALTEYAWPGNVRELRNVVARAALVCRGSVILPEHVSFDTAALPTVAPEASTTSSMSGGVHTTLPGATVRPDPFSKGDLHGDVRAFERARIVAALQKFGGHQGRTAEHLGVSRRTLTNKLTELDLPRPRKRKDDEE